MSTSLFRVEQHTLPVSHVREYPTATVDEDDELQLAIKQYTPLDNRNPTKGDITIIGGHANGFPKELYEPLWDELYARLKAKNVRIRGIWIADVAQQGASGILNEKKLGNDPSWMDHPRDLFLMINHFRKQIKQPVVGIGHSMGGCQLVILSLMHPRLFSTLVLIDPVIQRMPSMRGNAGPAKASTMRRDRWPSRNAAAASYKRSKFYQTWDQRVLDKWIEYGLRDTPTYIHPHANSSATPPVITADPSTATAPPEKNTEVEITLSTTKHQEVFTFMRPNYPTEDGKLDPYTHPDVDPAATPNTPFYRPESLAVFHRLPHLRPSVLYVFGDLSDMSAPLFRADKMAMTGVGVGGSGGLKAGRVREITFQGVGHLIPMEVVDKTADECAGWIVPEIERWRSQEEKMRAEWARVPRKEKGKMSELYVKTMTGNWADEVNSRPAKTSKL